MCDIVLSADFLCVQFVMFSFFKEYIQADFITFVGSLLCGRTWGWVKRTRIEEKVR